MTSTPFGIGEYVSHRPSSMLGQVVAMDGGGRALTVRKAGGGHDRWPAGECHYSTEAAYLSAETAATKKPPARQTAELTPVQALKQQLRDARLIRDRQEERMRRVPVSEMMHTLAGLALTLEMLLAAVLAGDKESEILARDLVEADGPRLAADLSLYEGAQT